LVGIIILILDIATSYIYILSPLAIFVKRLFEKMKNIF